MMVHQTHLSRPAASQLSAAAAAVATLLLLLAMRASPADGSKPRTPHKAGEHPLSPSANAPHESADVLNPIYPLLLPSERRGTATLTYNHDGSRTVLPLVRGPGGSATASGCEHYRTLDHGVAELTNCDGRIRATLHRPDGTFRIEFDAGAGVHFIRRLRPEAQRRPTAMRRTRRNHLSTVGVQGPYQANRHSKYVELLLVADNSLYRKLDSNEWQVYQYCSNLVNHINMLYNPLNVFIALTHVVVWSEGDPIHVSERADETLNRFLAYRAGTLLRERPHDHAQLLTAVEFRENVIGKAKVGGMCSDRSSGAIVRVHTDAVGVQASTLAHEMGHSFSMEHDEDADCACPDRRCIMTRSVTGLTLQHWSNCSLAQLAVGFGRGLHHCLDNRPARLALPSCGNGFVEPGEECDCGLEEACENHCCVAATCRLRAEAECATGECCDLARCRLRQPATPCRPERGECDLPEYCTGRSEFCPPDVHRRDTEECGGGGGGDGGAHCVAGRCRTRTDQCRALWGPSGRAASDACYGRNANGTKYGNCGYEGRPPERFRRCDEADVLCGLLFCQHRKPTEELELGEYNGETHYTVPKGNETRRRVMCYSAYVDLGVGQRGQLAAFVPDGARCGDGRMCFQQRCESIERLNARGLGGKRCAHDCYGRGVCNSEGHCHCGPGYDPPYCEHAGVGGSLDSGPAATGPGALWHLLTGAALVLLVCAVLLVLMVAYARSPQSPASVGGPRWTARRRPWRMYKVRGTSPREPVTAHHHPHPGHLVEGQGGTIGRRDISLPKYHSSTVDITDDQQFRPIDGAQPHRPAPRLPPPPVPAPTRVLPVPQPNGHLADPQLTVEYRIVPRGPQWRLPSPAPNHRQPRAF